jgi:hypothetical protein
MKRQNPARLLGNWAITVAAVGACSGLPTTAANAPIRAQPSWVTGQAAVALDSASGLFRLPVPTGRFSGVARAETLAMAVAKFLGESDLVGNGRDEFVRQHGSQIDFNHLHPCARAIYSVSPIGELPPSAPGWQRRSFAPLWGIALCESHAGVALSISIPDAPWDVTVSPDGSLKFRQGPVGGADFMITGIPTRYNDGLSLGPEAAVSALFDVTGVRINEVPSAYNQYERRLGTAAYCSSWRLRLEHPIAVTEVATGASRSVDELFVRRAAGCFSDSVAFFAPSRDQPTSLVLAVARDTMTLDAPLSDTISVALTGPLSFQRVIPANRTP